MLIDISVIEQDYIEDCEVCCNPIRVIVAVSNGEIQSLDPQIIGQ